MRSENSLRLTQIPKKKVLLIKCYYFFFRPNCDRFIRQINRQALFSTIIRFRYDFIMQIYLSSFDISNI